MKDSNGHGTPYPMTIPSNLIMAHSLMLVALKSLTSRIGSGKICQESYRVQGYGEGDSFIFTRENPGKSLISRGTDANYSNYFRNPMMVG
jgi:hypothetical protein